MESILTKHQVKSFRHAIDKDTVIVAQVRYDDQCGNGYNSFGITATISERRGNGKMVEVSGSCLHDDVARYFPQLAPLIKWHLCGSDGPLHYIPNTVFFAGDKDCWGYRKGEQKRSGDGLLMWESVGQPDYFIYSQVKPSATVEYAPVLGDGKDRELNAARNAAIWPDATDDDLILPGLEERLTARLPALMVEFKAAIESMGFVY